MREDYAHLELTRIDYGDGTERRLDREREQEPYLPRPRRRRVRSRYFSGLLFRPART